MASLNLVNCANLVEEETGLSTLPIVCLAEISQFFEEDPHKHVVVLSEKVREEFEAKFSRLFFVEDKLKVSFDELEEFKNDSEIPFLFNYLGFDGQAILISMMMKDLYLRSKFNNLTIPIAKYLVRIYKSFNEAERQIVDSFGDRANHLEGRLIWYYKGLLLEKGEFKLFMEEFGDEFIDSLSEFRSHQIHEYFNQIMTMEEREIVDKMVEYLKTASDVSKYSDFDHGKWLAHAFINNVPDDLIQFMKAKSDYIVKSLTNELLIANINYTDFINIHAGIERYFKSCQYHVSGIFLYEARIILSARYDQEIPTKIANLLGRPVEDVQKHCLVDESAIKYIKQMHWDDINSDFKSIVKSYFATMFLGNVLKAYNINDEYHELLNNLKSELKI